MVLLGASGGTTLSLSPAIIEDVGKFVGVSNRLPKSLQSTFAVPNPNAHAQ